MATFYDGSYGPTVVTPLSFNAIARIEVLKGPPGKLFGRSATAGVAYTTQAKHHCP